jgi:TonB family protein
MAWKEFVIQMKIFSAERLSQTPSRSCSVTYHSANLQFNSVRWVVRRLCAGAVFSIDHHGGVLHARVLHSSGSRLLDQPTLALVERAQPLPPPQSELACAEIAIVVPIRYNIRQRRQPAKSTPSGAVMRNSRIQEVPERGGGVEYLP